MGKRYCLICGEELESGGSDLCELCSRIPRVYRLLLKARFSDFFGWLSRRRLLLALFMYSLALCGFLFVIITPMLIMIFTYPIIGFPLNVAAALIPVIVFVVLRVRTEAESDLRFLKSVLSQRKLRKVEEILDEYLALINKKGEAKE